MRSATFRENLMVTRSIFSGYTMRSEKDWKQLEFDRLGGWAGA